MSIQQSVERIVAEGREGLDGKPVSAAAIDFMLNAKARNARSQAEKDTSRAAAVQRVLDAMRNG